MAGDWPDAHYRRVRRKARGITHVRPKDTGLRPHRLAEPLFPLGCLPRVHASRCVEAEPARGDRVMEFEGAKMIRPKELGL